MPSILMDPATVAPHDPTLSPINAAPSRPEERKAHELAPKPYEYATKDGVPNGSANHDSHPPPNAFTTTSSLNSEQTAPKVNGIKGAVANLNADSHLEKEKDGLTSVKEPDDYYVALQQDEKERPSPNQNEPHKEELMSGRKVGQRWHQSA